MSAQAENGTVGGRVHGKTAVVTGATGGIGLACVEALAREGAQVIGIDIKPPVGKFPENADFHLMDISDWDAWDELERVDALAGGVDVMVNAAGIAGRLAIDAIDRVEWDRVIEVNQTGVLLGIRAAVRSMLAHGRGGSIINISSIWGSTATSGLAAYHASKGAVTNLTRNAAVTYADRGIRANSIHPGLIRTPMSGTNADDFNADVIAATPLRRSGHPSEVAHGVVYLAADESLFVTGASLFIDGGFNAQ